MATNKSDERSSTGLLKWFRWTGFTDKTLWDWMQLLIVPIILGGGAFWFQSQASNTAQRSEDQRADAQLKIEDDRERQAALHTYLSNISTLLLDKNLIEATEENPVREIARATSLNTLRQLDSKRKGLLITFLYDSGLVGFTNPPGERDQNGIESADEIFPDSQLPIIDLFGADLSGADLNEAFLEGIDLFKADLTGANLKFADLNAAQLAFANLEGANLQGSDLSNANLSFANLKGVDLRGEFEAFLDGANLEFSDLTGANVTNQQIAQADSLEGLKLPDGSLIDSEEAARLFKQQHGRAE